MSGTHPHSDHAATRGHQVLILSHDAVAAALLGGLVETLGYPVHFARPTESADDTIRRVHPRVCLVDSQDRTSWSSEFFGRATMRGISVVIFGSPEALQRVRAVATAHNIHTLLMPPTLDTLEEILQRAGAD